MNRILLCGPPGCGKTMTAMAMATEIKLPLAYVRLDGLVSSYLGQTSTNLRKVFDSVKNRSLFKNKQVLQSNHFPGEILHREKQIKHIASILAPSLLGEKTSNLFVYGKTGTGKTLSVQHVANELSKRAEDNKRSAVIQSDK